MDSSKTPLRSEAPPTGRRPSLTNFISRKAKKASDRTKHQAASLDADNSGNDDEFDGFTDAPDALSNFPRWKTPRPASQARGSTRATSTAPATQKTILPPHLVFEDLQQAEAYQETRRSIANVKAEDVDHVYAHQPHYFKALLDAFNQQWLEEPIEIPGKCEKGRAQKLWNQWQTEELRKVESKVKSDYDSRLLIEVRVWQLLKEVIAVHRDGYVDGLEVEGKISCSERIAAIMGVIGGFTAVRGELVDGSKHFNVQILAAAPVGYGARRCTSFWHSKKAVFAKEKKRVAKEKKRQRKEGGKKEEQDGQRHRAQSAAARFEDDSWDDDGEGDDDGDDDDDDDIPRGARPRNTSEPTSRAQSQHEAGAPARMSKVPTPARRSRTPTPGPGARARTKSGARGRKTERAASAASVDARGTRSRRQIELLEHERARSKVRKEQQAAERSHRAQSVGRGAR